MTLQWLEDLPTTVYWVWTLVLVEATFILLPLTIYYLRRALKTARRLEGDLQEMAETGVNLAQLSGRLSTSIGSMDMAALLQLAESLQRPPVQVGPIATGLVHAGNGENPGGIP